MTLGIDSAVRDAELQAIADAINAGAAGLLRIYDGSRPATGGAATTLLVTLTFSDPCEATVTGGVLTFDTITSGTVVADGTATWCRFVTSAAAFVLDGDVSTSGADINFNSVAFVTGGNVAVSSLVFTCGNP
jgi:hypothetical protein